MKRLLFLLSLFLLVPIIQAQDTTCSPALSFNYDANTHIFSLVNASGDIVRTYTEIYHAIQQNHSPDCRFIVASLRTSPDETTSLYRDTIVWNATTGEQLQVFEGTFGRLYLIYWSPDSERLILSTRNGHFLWNFYTDELVQLTQQYSGWWLYLHWDTSRNEVFLLPYSNYQSSPEVLVYNWLNGTYIATFTSYINRDNYRSLGRSTFVIRDDWIIVAMYGVGRSPITIWDRNTGALITQLNGGSIGIMPIYEPAGDERQVALSPDRRYFVVADWSLKVWDMSNLAENYEDRRPSYQYHLDVDAVDAVHFIDNTTVEILLNDNITLIRMNILTGEVLE